MRTEELLDISDFDAFAALRHMPRPFIFSGSAAGHRRHSFVGADPFLALRTECGLTSVHGQSPLDGRRFDNPFAALSRILSVHGRGQTGPFPFNCGGAGYLSYDLKGLIEARMRSRKRTSPPEIPDCDFGFYDPVFVYDHAKKKGFLVSSGIDAQRLERFKSILSASKDAYREPPYEAAGSSFISNTAKEEYISAVIKAKEYISSGDIYQINLSHRLTMPWRKDPFSLYAGLVKTHPAPFSSYIDLGAFQLISNSPERLLKVEGRVAETSPIKGTRPRGATPEADRMLVEGLKNSVKESAEHIMIVDLERNDLGRICVPSTVEVCGLRVIESYPHLHHMTSTVSGRLKDGIDSPSALKAVFPGGSVTGAPKIRAVEIIDELEKAPRSVYTGGIGWIDFNGGMDIAMAIRTAVCMNGALRLSVGGGIVADSVPEDEYAETILKAKDFFSALGFRAEHA